MRVFVAIDLPPEVREKITRFLDGVRGFSEQARWTHPESLHVTLKFIGEQSEDQVAAVIKNLETVQANCFRLRFAGYGFFPTIKAPRVFWIGIQAGPELPALAAAIDSTLGELKIPREDRPFSPHLTLARAGGGSGSPKWRKEDGPNPVFAVLQKRLAAMGELDFGTITARGFFLYRSQLSPAGSKYTKLHSFSLR